MFEQIFRTQLIPVCSDKQLIETLWEEIRKHYSKAGRYYHTLAHLDHIVSELLAVEDKIADWQTLTFSIAYHDIIYNTLKNDNEERSAKLAMKRLSRLSVSAAQKEKCVAQIMATKGHAVSEDDDTNFFTDADLAILGSNPDEYSRYAEMIRKEYRLYPSFVYKPGRQKVLKHFLKMPRIYKSDCFYQKYEEQARKNLEDELRKLSY